MIQKAQAGNFSGWFGFNCKGAVIEVMRINAINAAKGLEELNFVKLESALLCANCELIVSETRNGKCPVCDSGALLSLSRLLGGTLHPPATDREAPRLHPESQRNGRPALTSWAG